MKILFVLPNDFLGGAEQLLKMIAARYSGENIKIIFLGKRTTTCWDEFSASSRIYSTSSSKLGSIIFLYRTLKKNNYDFDLVFTSHVYVNSTMGLFRHFGILKTKKFIARESSSILMRFSGLKLWTYKLAYRIGYRKIDLLICQTEFMKNQLVNGLPYLNKRLNIAVIQNPIDLDSIKLKSSNSVNNQETRYIVSAGRLIKEKGFDLLITAFFEARLHEHMKLLILGEGHERKKLENLSSSLGISNKVILVGQVANVYPYFKYADLCVVSSRIEGFPNVLLQMMSQNNKVVSTLCAGGIESIPGITTCQSNDLDSLNRALIACLNDNKSHRSEFDQFLKGRSVESYLQKIFDLTNAD